MRSTDDASHRSYPALQATKGGSSRGNLPLDPVLLPFAGAKGRPRRRGVQTRPCERPRDAVRRLQTRPRRRAVLIKPCIRLCDADRRLQTWPPPGRRASSALRKALRRRQARRKLDGEGGRGGWGAGLRWAEDGPPPAGGTAHVHTIINYHTTKRRRCQCVILCRGMVVILGQNCYTGVKG